MTIEFGLLSAQDGDHSAQLGGIRDQRVWSICECASVFAESLKLCKDQLMNSGDCGTLAWDKVGVILFSVSTDVLTLIKVTYV